MLKRNWLVALLMVFLFASTNMMEAYAASSSSGGRSSSPSSTPARVSTPSPVTTKASVPTGTSWAGAKTETAPAKQTTVAPVQTTTVAQTPKADVKATAPTVTEKWGGSTSAQTNLGTTAPIQAANTAATAQQGNTAALKADVKATAPTVTEKWGGTTAETSKTQINAPVQANAAAASAVQANVATPSAPKVIDKATVPAGTGQWANTAQSKDNLKAAAPIAQSSGNANVSKAPVMGKSDADKALYEKAKMSGNTYQNREQAVAAIKAKDPEKFKTQFEVEPKTRPASIPSTTRVDNRDVAVVFDSMNHGYGYYTPNHVWVPYVVTVSDNDLRSYGAYYGPPPSSGHAMLSVVVLLSLIALIVVTILVLRNRRNS